MYDNLENIITMKIMIYVLLKTQYLKVCHIKDKYFVN